MSLSVHTMFGERSAAPEDIASPVRIHLDDLPAAEDSPQPEADRTPSLVPLLVSFWLEDAIG